MSNTDTYTPTPTQDENDRAAMGEHVMDKEPDGSPEQDSVAVQEQKARDARTKQMEAKQPTSTAGYPTKQMTAEHSTAKPATQPKPAAATPTKHE